MKKYRLRWKRTKTKSWKDEKKKRKNPKEMWADKKIREAYLSSALIFSVNTQHQLQQRWIFLPVTIAVQSCWCQQAGSALQHWVLWVRQRVLCLLLLMLWLTHKSVHTALSVFAEGMWIITKRSEHSINWMKAACAAGDGVSPTNWCHDKRPCV